MRFDLAQIKTGLACCANRTPPHGAPALSAPLRLCGEKALSWLPDMDLNHDKQIQSLLCYRYTIGQAGASDRLNTLPGPSRRQAGNFAPDEAEN